MKRIQKITSILLVFAISLSFFTACGRKKGEPPVSTGDKRTVLTFGEYNVSYDFYRYLFLNSKEHFDNGDDTYWTKDGNDVKKITDYVLNSLKNTYGMFALADKYDINLSKEDKEDIKAYIESSKSGLTDSEFKESLAQSYMTEDVYTFALEVQQLEYLVYDHITNEANGILKIDDNAFLTALDNDFVRATHILFTFNTPDEEKTQLTKAQSVLEKLKNGEDFETLKEAYSDDTDLKGNKDGYYFTHGEFQNEFEYTAFDLKEGELSEIITTELGYHIVKRLPIEDKYVNEHFEELRHSYKTAVYYKLIDDWAESATVEYKDAYNNINLDSFKEE